MGLEDFLDGWANEPDMIDPIDGLGNEARVDGKFSLWRVAAFIAIGGLVFFPAALWSQHWERIVWIVVGLVIWGWSASVLLVPRDGRAAWR